MIYKSGQEAQEDTNSTSTTLGSLLPGMDKIGLFALAF
jgi:hypothetical protein